MENNNNIVLMFGMLGCFDW